MNSKIRTKKIKASIVILTWNQLDFTKDCLRSLFKQDFKDFEVIVVDNASTDNTVDYIQKEYPQIRIIMNKKNLGFPEGNNVGAKYARGEYVILLNNDTTVDKKWLSELLKFMDKNKKTAVAMSKIYDKYDQDKFTFQTTTINPLGYPIIFKFDSKKDNWPFYVIGCSLIYRRKIIGKPFDGDYFLYAEDTHLSWRARLIGYDVKFCDKSIVKHYGEISSKKFKSMKNYYMERNRIWNYLIFYDVRNVIFLLPWMLFSMIFHNIYDFQNAGYRFKGYYHAIKDWKNVMKKRRSIQKLRKSDDLVVTRFMSRKFFDDKSFTNPLSKTIIRIINAIFAGYTWLFRIIV